MMAETCKTIQRVKRQQNPMFFQGVNQPDRTLRIMYQGQEPAAAGKGNSRSVGSRQQGRQRGKQKLNLAAEHIDIKAMGEGDAQSIMKRMKLIEDQFMSNPTAHDPAHAFARIAKEKKDEDEDEEDGADANMEHEQFSN